MTRVPRRPLSGCPVTSTHADAVLEVVKRNRAEEENTQLRARLEASERVQRESQAEAQRKVDSLRRQVD